MMKKPWSIASCQAAVPTDGLGDGVLDRAVHQELRGYSALVLVRLTITE